MRELLKKRILVLDGAMGTQLQDIVGDSVPEMLNLTNPEAVQAVHRKYLEAGADLVLTNSFGGNAVRLARFGLADRLVELNELAVENARKAGARWVIGSVGPTGEMSVPMGSFTYDDFYQAFVPQVQALLGAGVDGIAVETMLDVIELKAAVGAVRDLSKEIPLVAQVSLMTGRTMNGTDLPAVAVMLEAMGVDVIGMNCVSLTEELPALLESAADVIGRPLIVQPNAGLPDQSGCHHLDLAEWRRIMRMVVETRGMGIVGGCCGTNPEAIRVLRELVDEVQCKKDYVFTGDSGRGAVTRLAGRMGVLTLDKGPYIIGERINPSGRPDLQKFLQNEDWYSVCDEGLAQVEAGAVMLDVNVGQAGIDQKKAMAEIVQQLQVMTPVPLVLDSPDPAVLEAGLKVYVGKAVINSCNASAKSLAEVLPLAQKYGAAVIGLCLDENGVPEKAEERVRLGLKIMEEARRLGIAESDIFLDPLVLSAAMGAGSVETLRTIEMLRGKGNVRLVAGVSNVSYGLPERELLNRVFLSMAFGAGLDFAIANPTDEQVLAAVNAARVLLGRDEDCLGYLSYCRGK